MDRDQLSRLLEENDVEGELIKRIREMIKGLVAQNSAASLKEVLSFYLLELKGISTRIDEGDGGLIVIFEGIKPVIQEVNDNE